ncbi:FAD:protein FMN transferase [Sinomonas cellulolyticus]|nr:MULTISPECIES: FAD:protein FMN transferase [Sinomonas]GHG50901.1 FAD:protein FMN transferase [Sinomonas sp. KCTC 49339]
MQPTSELRARTFECMGTVVSLTVPRGRADADAADGDAAGAAEDARFEAAVAVVEEQFRALDAQFSLFRPASEASRIARGELALMDSSALMRDLYADAVRWRRRTDGAFTPERPDGALDLSGLVKGYAIAEAGRSLAALGLADWCLNAGGDVLVSGSPSPSAAPSPARRTGAEGVAAPWLAGIVDAADRRTLLSAYPLGERRLALATSGSAERGDHIWTAGVRGPRRTGRPEFVQVSVAATDIVTADVLATAIVAGGRPTLDAVTSRWDVDVLTVAHDGALLATPGFRATSAA